MGAWKGGDGDPQEEERGKERKTNSGLNGGRVAFLTNGGWGVGLAGSDGGAPLLII